MMKSIESKLDSAKFNAKLFFDKEWFNACKMAEHILYLQKEYKTDFIFAFNNRLYVAVKGNDFRFGSTTMAYNVTPKQLADEFNHDQVIDQYFRDYFKNENIDGLKFYLEENEDAVIAKELSWLEDFGF